MKSITYMSCRLLAAVAVVTALGAVQQVAAQPGSGGPTPTTPTTTPTPTSVPIDGGASLLLAGGVAYGLRHLKQRRQK